MNYLINDRIMAIIEELHLTYASFGEGIGVTRSTISKIKSHSIKVSEQIIVAICSVYCVNEEWLRTGKGEMFNKDSQLEIQLGKLAADPDEFKRALVNNICKLSDEEWETLKKIVLSTCEDINKNKRDS